MMLMIIFTFECTIFVGKELETTPNSKNHSLILQVTSETFTVLFQLASQFIIQCHRNRKHLREPLGTKKRRSSRKHKNRFRKTLQTLQFGGVQARHGDNNVVSCRGRFLTETCLVFSSVVNKTSGGRRPMRRRRDALARPARYRRRAGTLARTHARSRLLGSLEAYFRSTIAEFASRYAA